MYREAKVRSKDGERTISVDEMTHVQAVERLHPDLPMQPGHVVRREFEYIRHGTLTCFLNLDVVTGEVIAPSFGNTRTEADFLAHIRYLVASDPNACKWRIIMDNLNTHQSEALVRWIAKMEGVPEEALGEKGKSGRAPRLWKREPPFCMILLTKLFFIIHQNMLHG